MVDIVEHKDATSCEVAAQEQVDAAFYHRKEWMVVVFSKEGDQVIVEKTTCSFPRGLFDECLVTLKRMLEAETAGDRRISSLPLASHLEDNGEIKAIRPSLTEDQSRQIEERIRRLHREPLLTDNVQEDKKNNEQDT